MVNLTINGKAISAAENTTVLEAARANGIDIPTLCYLKDLFEDSVCRICMVEVVGKSRLMPACSTKVKEGMIVTTDSDKCAASRRTTLDFICRHHRMDCETCSRYSDCELHALLVRYGMDDRMYSSVYHAPDKDRSSAAVIRDYSKCIKCRKCEAICRAVGVGAVKISGMADKTRVGFTISAEANGCVGCGMCVSVCPVGALSVKNDNKLLRIALNQKRPVVAALFGPEGTEAGKLVSLLHGMGFAAVVDGGRFAAQTDDICPLKEHEGSLPETLFHTWAKAHYGKDCFTVWISACTALKYEHACDDAMTEAELAEFIRHAAVSRYTMRQMWRDAAATPFDESIAGESKEPRAFDKLFCPGGCASCGGAWHIDRT